MDGFSPSRWARWCLVDCSWQACDSADSPAEAQGVLADLPGVTQNRDKALPAAQRFVILPAFNSDAVLDKETGLVWEKSPQTTSAKWSVARRTCIEKNVGGQKVGGCHPSKSWPVWWIPSVAPPGLALPPGHPFLAVQSAVYWSSTRVGEDPRGSWGVHFGLGGGATFINWAHSVQVWCVRGGMKARISNVRRLNEVVMPRCFSGEPSPDYS